MIKSTKSETVVELSIIGKKEWQEPQITQLTIKNTKGGWDIDVAEGTWIFFGSH